MPMKKPCCDGLASAVTMPTTWPLRLSSGPPELPGLTAASNWMRPFSVVPPSTGIERFEPGDDAGAQRVDQAERMADGEGGVADLHAARR